MLLCFIVVILDVILIHILHLLDKILKDYNEIGHIRLRYAKNIIQNL